MNQTLQTRTRIECEHSHHDKGTFDVVEALQAAAGIDCLNLEWIFDRAEQVNGYPS